MINVSTKVNLLLTAEIDRIRNYNIFEKPKGRLQTISNQDKFTEVRQNVGTPTTIEITPGILHVNGVLVDVKDIESLSLLGLSDGNYRIKVAVDNSLDPATATLVAEQVSSTLYDQDLTELENGKADLEMATLTLTSSNVTNFVVVVETIKTIKDVQSDLIDLINAPKKDVVLTSSITSPNAIGIDFSTLDYDYYIFYVGIGGVGNPMIVNKNMAGTHLQGGIIGQFPEVSPSGHTSYTAKVPLSGASSEMTYQVHFRPTTYGGLHSALGNITVYKIEGVYY